jgi:hypothetical protein
MREKYLILLGVIVVVTLAFFYSANTIISNRTVDIRRVDRNIRRAQERLNSAKVMDEQLSQVSKVIENTLTSDRFFSAEEINEFVRLLAEFADRHQIAVHSLVPRPMFSAANRIEHQFVMDFMCTYVQMGRFLTMIESMDHVIKVNTLDVRPERRPEQAVDSESEQVTKYRVILELSIFKIVKEA